jgi:hypothetical protein
MKSISDNVHKIIILENLGLLRYLDFSTKLALSQVCSKVRSKLLPQVFSKNTLNTTIIEKLPNYFKTPSLLNFDNFSYLEKLLLLTSYGFDKDFAFTELQVEPFIEESINTLKPVAKYFKTVEFYLMGFSAYFMVPILDSFINLKELNLRRCEFPYTKFVDLLGKLEKLKTLDMKGINLIMYSHEDSNQADNLQFPKSLNYLTFQFVHLEISKLSKVKPLKFVQNPQHVYTGQILLPKPQILANLIELIIFDRNDGKIMEEFKILNPKLKVINDALRYGFSS